MQHCYGEARTLEQTPETCRRRPLTLFRASSASQQRRVLDELYFILDNTFQRVRLQETLAPTSSHISESSDQGSTTIPMMHSNSEIGIENERGVPLGNISPVLSIPSRHQRNYSSSSEPMSPQGRLSTRNLIAWIEAIPSRSSQSPIEKRSSIQSEQSSSVPYPSLLFESELPCSSVEYLSTSATSPVFNKDSIKNGTETVAKKNVGRFSAFGSKAVDVARRDRISESLIGIFPKLPQCLEKVPFHIRYEITRVFLHADVDIPQKLKLPKFSHLQEYNNLWNYLKGLPELKEKRFPERVSAEAWRIASDQIQSRLRGVSMMASLSLQNKIGMPIFHLELQPFGIDQTSRLSRRFGCDRFMKISIPCLAEEFRGVMNSSDSHWQRKTEEWIFGMAHSFLGRTWQLVFLKDAPRPKASSNTSTGRKSSRKRMHHHYFFATESPDFQPRTLASNEGLLDGRADMELSTLVRWLIPLEMNREEPYLKLYSRISLGLTRTRETVELQKSQILPRCDILAANIKMNDGCGRLSQEMAMSIKDRLNLVNLPSAYQGRIGGAKGLWLIDTTNDAKKGIWIEVYSSQEKWHRDTSIQAGADDPAHRTFEVLNYSRPCKPATLNDQLIPVLESCEVVGGVMRKTISKLLAMGMRFEIDELRIAMKSPERLRLWIQSTYPTIRENIGSESVPYNGGFPQRTEEQINLLLDSGFQPNQLLYMRNGVKELLVKKLTAIRENLHIAVPSSTNALIGVDFGRYLESDEIHLVFSRPIIDERTGESLSCLDGRYVLVARNPAHLPSDIQKVKARFVPELMAITDVALFSIKGESPLAGKLSGGDYDGDRCWICWDEELVNNFENFQVPAKYNFVEEGYITKDTDTYGDIVSANSNPVPVFLRRSFLFNTQPNPLGECTNYKKAKCRSGFPLKSPQITRLCALIAELVDGPKQGTTLIREAWSRLKKEIETTHREQAHLNNSTDHILDYLERAAKDAIDKALIEFKDIAANCYLYDKDLAVLARKFQETACTSEPAKLVLSKLKADIDIIRNKWLDRAANNGLGKKLNSYQDHIQECSLMWQAIEPAVTDAQTSLFPDPWEPNPHYSKWSLLKASLTFLWHYGAGGFPWWICGQQLCLLKAITTGRFNAVSTPMYGILKPNAAVVRRQQDVMAEGGSGDGIDVDDDCASDGGDDYS